MSCGKINTEYEHNLDLQYGTIQRENTGYGIAGGTRNKAKAER
jgi:hypothetical protein